MALKSKTKTATDHTFQDDINLILKLSIKALEAHWPLIASCLSPVSLAGKDKIGKNVVKADSSAKLTLSCINLLFSFRFSQFAD